MSSFAKHFPRLNSYRLFLSRASHVGLAAALLGWALALPAAQASPDNPGPLFGAPGDGEPYLHRLHPRVLLAPMPERNPFTTDHHDHAPKSSSAYGSPRPPRKARRRSHKEDRYDYVEPSYKDAPSPYEERSRPPYRDRRSYAEHKDRGEGFGRLFPRAHYDDTPSSYEALRALGRSMVEEVRADDPAGDSEVPAGYTFLGQFIDHDVTLETTTDLGHEIHGDFELKNARTPDLDLDSVYGGGPAVTPHLFRLPYIRVGKAISHERGPARYDLFRTKASYYFGPEGGKAVALAGDPRNDENIVVSQLHAAFVAFHNRTTDILVEREFGDDRKRYCRHYNHCDTHELAEALPDDAKRKIFETAQDHTIHYYHRLIVEDFLPRVIGPRHTRSLLKHGRDFFFPKGFSGRGPRLADIHIPIEFAGAAFRYGHSQVRDSYTLRDRKRVDLLSGGERGAPRAFEPVTPRFLVDWRYFFEIEPEPPYGFNHARLMDPELVKALHELHVSRVVGIDEVTSLAARNLARGRTTHLPTGQDVAKIILPALQERGLLGKAQGYERDSWRAFLLPPDRRTRYFLGEAETPLWYYILQEASIFGSRTGLYAEPVKHGPRRYSLKHDPRRSGTLYHNASARESFRGRKDYGRSHHGPEGGHRLGPVGAAIVGEVLTGLVEHYRIKTGKGLDYRPLIRGSESALAGLDRRKASRHRYLMRNFLIDAGVVETY